MKMKRFYVNLYILFILVFNFSCKKQTDHPVPQIQSIDLTEARDEKTIHFLKSLESTIPQLLKKNNIPGAIFSVVHKGKPVWYGAFGYADLENKRPMSLDNICRVESISKPVTTWGVMKLVKDGFINLDEPINNYLKNWSFPPSKFDVGKITVRHLLTHSSGLKLGTIGVHYAPDGKNPSLESALSNDAVLFQNPGQSFSYSNVGFNLLELIIQETTGKDFGEYIKEEVLIPLGMMESGFGWEPRFYDKVPNGYDFTNNPIPPYVYPERAAGGLFSTIEDISKFVLAGMPEYSQSGTGILQKDFIYQMYLEEVKVSGFYYLVFPHYGLGHFLEYFPNGENGISHGGQGSGWMTHFHSIPESGDAIIILTNSQRSWPFFADILKIWGEYLDLGKVGMSLISLGNNLIWILLIFLGSGSILLLAFILNDLKSGKRNFNTSSQGLDYFHFFKLFGGSMLILLLIWAIAQPYLIIEAIFPTSSIWLGISIFLFAVYLISSAIFPKKNFYEKAED